MKSRRKEQLETAGLKLSLSSERSTAYLHISPPAPSGSTPLNADIAAIDLLERRPRKFVRPFQVGRIEECLLNAATTSSWWRDRLAPFSGTTSMFSDAPIMTRQNFQHAVQAGPVPVQRFDTIHENVTSGSSGIPVRFWYSGVAARLNNAHNHYEETVRQGRDPKRLRAVLRPGVEPHTTPDLKRSPNFVERRLGQSSLDADAQWLSAIQPAYFCTWPSALDGILDAYESGLSRPPRLERVITFAETVDKQLRDRVTRVLKTTLLDRYSCEEVGPLAYECRHKEGWYHVASSNVLLEVVDDSGILCVPGQVGNVVVTSLHNWASPVLRYDLGDMAASAPRCACGFQGGAINNLLGRRHFLIRLPSGERKVLRFNSSGLLAIAPIVEHRVVQTSPTNIRAEVVLERPLTELEHDGIVANLRDQISPHLTYNVVQLDAIPWAESKKRQDIVSFV